MKILLTATCLLLLNVVANADIQASNEDPTGTNVLTSEEVLFAFEDLNQASALVPLSSAEMANTRGNSLCADVVNGSSIYVYCSPPYPLEFVKGLAPH